MMMEIEGRNRRDILVSFEGSPLAGCLRPTPLFPAGGFRPQSLCIRIYPTGYSGAQLVIENANLICKRAAKGMNKGTKIRVTFK